MVQYTANVVQHHLYMVIKIKIANVTKMLILLTKIDEVVQLRGKKMKLVINTIEDVTY